MSVKIGITYNRKLSGTCFLTLRCLFDLAIIGYGFKDVICTPSTSAILANFFFLLTTIFDLIFCLIFLFIPGSTCEGNTYLKCLAFIFNSYLSNLLIYYIDLKSLFDSDRPDRRIPYFSALIICSLLMYGGIACPLNLAWMETFKPFSRIILVNRAAI